MSLLQTAMEIKPLNQEVMEQTQARLDSLTKPPGSLGRLEEIAKQIAGIRGQVVPQVGKKAVIVMAGDHGIVEAGVTPYPQEVTAQMVMNFVNQGAAINVLSKHVGAEVKVVDIGVKSDLDHPTVIQRKVKRGTENMLKGPAMTREEAVQAIEVGMEVAHEAIAQGVTLLATGDMGIGNTTPSSAIVAVFGGFPAAEVTGRGTGIDDAGLIVKQKAIDQAIAFNQPDKNDALDVLAKVGGLEIAGLAGVILGGATKGVPVLIDGFISTAAALIAANLVPQSKDYMIASHGSVEPGHQLMMELLGKKPMLDLDMRLGEGTGAVLAMELVDAALKVLAQMATFAEAGVSDRD